MPPSSTVKRLGLLVIAEDRPGHLLFATGIGPEVVVRTREIAPKLIEAPLEWTEFRHLAEVPLASASIRMKFGGFGELVAGSADTVPDPRAARISR
jgi:hypothetical protein